jgi:heme exporter protein D
MLELGKYAAPVFFAYGATLTLLLGIIIISFVQSVSKSKYLKNLKKN